jgi:hypothetical protein
MQMKESKKSARNWKMFGSLGPHTIRWHKQRDLLLAMRANQNRPAPADHPASIGQSLSRKEMHLRFSQGQGQSLFRIPGQVNHFSYLE